MWLARQRACRGHFFLSFHGHLPASLRLFSCSAGCGGAPSPPAEPTHFMVDYLRSSCGFSNPEARKMSTHYAHLKSSEKPDAILSLLKQEGLGNAEIKRVVQNLPRLLLADAKRTVEPKIRALHGAGFSRPEVAQLILMNPGNIFYVRDVVPRVEFWRKLVGTNQDILKTMKKDPRMLCYNLDNRVVPGLSLLRSVGVPDCKMGSLVRMRPRLVSSNPDKVRALVEHVKSLGISSGTGMFAEALCSVSNVSRLTLDAKSKLLRSFGWTQAHLDSAVRRFPVILRYSQTKIQAAMDFLLNEVGCDPSYIARHPALVGFSVEKRLKPRFCILQYLKAEGIPAWRNDFSSVMKISEGTFLRRYIIPYGGKLPKLLETNHAACTEGC